MQEDLENLIAFDSHQPLCVCVPNWYHYLCTEGESCRVCRVWSWFEAILFPLFNYSPHGKWIELVYMYSTKIQCIHPLLLPTVSLKICLFFLNIIVCAHLLTICGLTTHRSLWRPLPRGQAGSPWNTGRSRWCSRSARCHTPSSQTPCTHSGLCSERDTVRCWLVTDKQRHKRNHMCNQTLTQTHAPPHTHSYSLRCSSASSVMAVQQESARRPVV